MNQRLLIVRGLKRSGNHAIINWLRAQDRFLFFNNIIPLAAILRGQASIPPAEDYTAWLRRKTPLRRRIWPGSRKWPVIVGLEDHELSLNPFLDPPAVTQNLLLLRDPANLFASRIRMARRGEHPAFPTEMNDTMRQTIKLWKDYAREFLGDTNVLNNKIRVYFNTWFTDQDYRRNLSLALGLSFSDAGFAIVSDRGGGSSFDQTTFTGNNQAMRVLDRHAQLDEREHRLLDAVLDDQDLRELADRISRVPAS